MTLFKYKKISELPDASISQIDSTAKLLATVGAEKSNVNINISDIVVSKLDSDSDHLALSASMGKALDEAKAPVENPTFTGEITFGGAKIRGDENLINISLNGEGVVHAYIDHSDHSTDVMEFGDRSYAISEFKGKNVGILTGNPDGGGMGTGFISMDAKGLIINTNTAPSSPNAPGTAREVRFVGNYIYVCVSDNA